MATIELDGGHFFLATNYRYVVLLSSGWTIDCDMHPLRLPRGSYRLWGSASDGLSRLSRRKREVPAGGSWPL